LSAVSYTLPWLLDLLERRNLITTVIRRDVEVRSPQQRARCIKQRSGEGIGDSQVSPAELLASFVHSDTRGEPIDDDSLARLVAEETHLPYLKVDPLELDMGLVSQTLSRPFALRHVVLPLKQDATSITAAVEDPFDTEVVENLQRIAKREVRRVIASKRDILKCLTEIYGFRRSMDAAAAESAGDAMHDFEQLVRLRTVGEIEGSDQHVINAVDFLFTYAFEQRASDIHIEPRKDLSQVRLRIDGVLHDVHTVPRQVHPALISRIKTMARLDIAERRRPQDGRIKTMLGQKAVEMRVSTLPTAFGEKAVLRIFDPVVLLQDLPGLGFEAHDLAIFERWIAEPHGLILITGPTGSGKTTTLYATLKTLSDETVNVTTVEDPIEMVTDIFNQVAVQPKIGVDFPTALRTILRQDPDIIMVGEIRDGATGEMAVQAALTGHLVFSTLHTNDTATAVTRLLDLGIQNFLVSSTVVGVMAQRLMRSICAACKQPHPLDIDQLAALGVQSAEAPRFAGSALGAGCVACRGTGYLGRLGIFEILDFTAAMRQCVLHEGTAEAIGALARTEGLRSLRECALDRLAAGQTTFEEVVRVTGISR
jgi:general secretion pathway protein E